MIRESYVTRQNLDNASLWANKPPLLGRLDLELTERCNNNCMHCYINLPADACEAKKKELGTDEIKRILKETVSLGCLAVRFTGGEPLLREDFEELYVFARRQGLKVLLFTNATLINAHLVELFSNVPPLEKIEVTVYGMKKESYEAATRMPGSFEAAQRGIKLLLENNIPFVVKGCLLPSALTEVEEFEKWSETLPWMNRPPSYAMFFDLRCRRGEGKEDIIRKLRVSPEVGLRVLTRRKDEYVRGMKEFCAQFTRPPGEKLFSCGAGCASGCVDAYGTFQLCIPLRHADAVYDLKNGSLRDALENFFPEIRKLKAVNSAYLKRCVQCFLKGLCEQCPGKSWMEYGTMDTPVEYLCEVAHCQARFLGLLKENEMGWEIEDWKERIRKFTEKQ